MAKRRSGRRNKPGGYTGENSKHIRKIRLRLLSQQGGLCSHCKVRVWEHSVMTKTEYMLLMDHCYGMKLSKREVTTDYLSTLDHYIPRSQGGKASDPRNTVMCSKCNNAKADMPARRFSCPATKWTTQNKPHVGLKTTSATKVFSGIGERSAPEIYHVSTSRLKTSWLSSSTLSCNGSKPERK